MRAGSASGPGRYELRVEALRGASADDRLAAGTYRRFREAQGFAREARAKARRVWTEALPTWRRLGEPVLEAEILDRLALDHYDHGEYGSAVERYREAAALLAESGERHWERIVRNNLADCLVATAEVDEAIEEYRSILALARETGDRRLEAETLNGLGTAYFQQGEIQKALSHLEGALDLLPPDDFLTRPLALHNLGVLYALYFEDPERGRELLLAALELYRPGEIPDHPAHKARALKQLALIARREGRTDEARSRFEESLELSTGSDRCGRATALSSLALLEEENGSQRAADARMAEAFETLGQDPCPPSRVSLEQVAGTIAERRGETAAALVAFQRSRDLAATQGDRARLASSLTAIAHVEHSLGRPREALDSNSRALAILEEVRPTVLRDDLRAAYFATAQDVFDLQIELLITLGAGEEAWLAAERARAQALRDLLLEAGAGLRGGADPILVERERSLQRQLNYIASTGRARAKSAALVEEIERTRGEIRRQSPSYAAVTAPEPLSLAGVRRDLLDDDTLLLEYRLGEEASWLWAITRDSFASFQLPPRAEIERSAGVAARWTRSLQWPGYNPRPVCELARAVLGPAASLLRERRLLVVPDGALEAVAFAALPDPAAPGPCDEAPPLVAGHEIVHLPSVATLAAQRRSLAGRPPAPGWVAVVADPVYGANDERLRGPGAARPAALARSAAR
ncbi:MAG TPA: tetratricopeptide repeat protein, partial [Thermoanaerobaculia bacterium]|nr:tetratricopeptide repeat protein [Thermoanaerobaculia bacterium]